MTPQAQIEIGTIQHRKIVPTLILSLLFVGAWFAFDTWVDVLVGLFPDRISGIALIHTALTAISWVVAGWFVSKLIKVYFWPGFVERQSQKAVPKLMIDILDALIMAAILSGILITAFDISPAMVGAMSGGMVVLIALFLKRPLDDIFAGLSLHIDPAINLGDHIALESGQVGRVEEITWRSTRLSAPDSTSVIVPNSVISTAILTNFSSPTSIKRVELTATLDFVVPIERVLRVFDAALRATIGSGGIVSKPRPQATVDGPAAYGITYRIQFYFDLQKTSEEQARTAVMRHIMVHLSNAGLAFSLPKENVFLGRVRMRQMDWMRNSDRKNLLAGNVLFNELRFAEMEFLAEKIVVHEYRAGEAIIRQGETDTSMFGLAEGLLEVTVKLEGDDKSVQISEIEPGGFFGEMSLLANEPRSATVTTLMDSVIFEITRETAIEIINQFPEIGVMLSRVVAQRQFETSNIIEIASNKEKEEAISSNADTLLRRMAAIFGTALKRRA